MICNNSHSVAHSIPKININKIKHINQWLYSKKHVFPRADHTTTNPAYVATIKPRPSPRRSSSDSSKLSNTLPLATTSYGNGGGVWAEPQTVKTSRTDKSFVHFFIFPRLFIQRRVQRLNCENEAEGEFSEPAQVSSRTLCVSMTFPAAHCLTDLYLFSFLFMFVVRTDTCGCLTSGRVLQQIGFVEATLTVVNFHLLWRDFR